MKTKKPLRQAVGYSRFAVICVLFIGAGLPVSGAAAATLTMVVSPVDGGSSNPGAGAHTVTLGQPVDIVAIPEQGYFFVVWTVAGSAVVGDPSATSTSVILAGDATVTAQFASECAPDTAAQRAKFAYGIVQTAGGGAGLLAFGPLCARFGRRRTFIAMQVLAFLIVPAVCFGPRTYHQLLCVLPVFGFITLGMHAGYAIYFPELFPTHLRATGTSFCFNGGRVLAVPVLFFSGWLKAREGMDLHAAISLLGLLFLAGVVVMLFLPETKGQELPE